MGLDELHLRVLATSSDDEKEKRNAHTGTFGRLGKDSVDHWYSIETDGEGQALGSSGS